MRRVGDSGIDQPGARGAGFSVSVVADAHGKSCGFVTSMGLPQEYIHDPFCPFP